MTLEILEGRGCGPNKDYIELQLSHLPQDVLETRLPGIMETARIFAGVDVTREPIPVLPTVHYNMGGIPTNLHAEAVTLRHGDPNAPVAGLMAIGEAACVSVHGANRLGSNSLIDLIVFGRTAAQQTAKTVQFGEHCAPLDTGSEDRALSRFDRIRQAKGPRKCGEIRLEMQRIMQVHCAVFRDGPLLDEGVAGIDRLGASLRDDLGLGDHSLIWNTDLAESIELDNMMAQARVSLHSAVARTESRGAHAREDYPARDDVNWLKHTLAWMTEEGGVSVAYRPVHLKTLSNEVEPVPPKARIY